MFDLEGFIMKEQLDLNSRAEGKQLQLISIEHKPTEAILGSAASQPVVHKQNTCKYVGNADHSSVKFSVRNSEKNSARRRRIVARQKRSILICALTCMLVIIFALSLGGTSAQATAGHTYEKCYASVRIERGDSLWSIASAYTDGSVKEIQNCIDEIRSINGIGKFETIKAGDYLAVPYYVMQ
jgi:hypothetical protein